MGDLVCNRFFEAYSVASVSGSGPIVNTKEQVRTVGQSVPELMGKARARQRRLAHWLKQHHAELVIELGTGRVDWQPLLAVVTRLGLVDERGVPPTTTTLARTWRRVKRRMDAASREETLRPDEIVRGVRLVAASSSPVQEAEAADQHSRLPTILIQPVRPRAASQVITTSPASEPTTSLREGQSTGSPPAATPITVEQQDQGADRLADTLRAALGRAGRGRVPLPVDTL